PRRPSASSRRSPWSGHCWSTCRASCRFPSVRPACWPPRCRCPGRSARRSPACFLALGSELSPRYRGALLGLLSLTNQGGTVLGSSLGGLAIGLGSYSTLALLTVCGGVAAAAIAVPLARSHRA